MLFECLLPKRLPNLFDRCILSDLEQLIVLSIVNLIVALFLICLLFIMSLVTPKHVCCIARIFYIQSKIQILFQAISFGKKCTSVFKQRCKRQTKKQQKNRRKRSKNYLITINYLFFKFIIFLLNTLYLQFYQQNRLTVTQKIEQSMGQQNSQIQSQIGSKKLDFNYQNQKFQFKHIRPQLLSNHDLPNNRKSIGKIKNKQISTNVVNKDKSHSPIIVQDQTAYIQAFNHQIKGKSVIKPSLQIEIQEQENQKPLQMAQKDKQIRLSEKTIHGVVRFSKYRFQNSQKVSLSNGSILFIQNQFFDSSTRTLAQVIQKRLQMNQDQQLSKRYRIIPQKDIQNMIQSLCITLCLLQEEGINYAGFNYKFKSNYMQIFNWMQKIIILKTGQVKLIPNQLLFLACKNHKQKNVKYQKIRQNITECSNVESNIRKLGILILRVCYLTLTGTLIQQDSQFAQNNQLQLAVDSQLQRLSQYYDEHCIKIIRKMIFSKCTIRQFKNWLDQIKAQKKTKQQKQSKLNNPNRSVSNSQTTRRSCNKNEVSKHTTKLKTNQMRKIKIVQGQKSIQKFRQYQPKRETEETQRYYALRQRISKSPFKNYQRKNEKDNQIREQIPQRTKRTKRNMSSYQVKKISKISPQNKQTTLQQNVRGKQHKTNQVYFKRQHLMGDKSNQKSPKNNGNPRYAYLDHETQIYVKSHQRQETDHNCMNKNQVPGLQYQRLKRIEYALDNRIKISNELFKNNRRYQDCTINMKQRNQRQHSNKTKYEYSYDFKMVNQEDSNEHQFRLKKEHLYNRPIDEVYSKQNRLQPKSSNIRWHNKNLQKNSIIKHLKRQQSRSIIKFQSKLESDHSQHSFQKHQIEVPQNFRQTINEHHLQEENHFQILSKIDQPQLQTDNHFYCQQSQVQKVGRDFSPNFNDRSRTSLLQPQKLHFHSQTVQLGSDEEIDKPTHQRYMIKQRSLNDFNLQPNSVYKIKAQIARSKKLIDGIKRQRHPKDNYSKKYNQQGKQNSIGF